MVKLFKYTKKGQVQQWQIFVKGNSFYTEEGIVNGKITKSLPTYCYGKNLGKKNATTDEEQAYAEAIAKHKRKIESGYNEILTDKKNFFEPMLAHSIKDYKHLLFKVRTFIQPKLDGIRCDNRDNKMHSRKGKEFTGCPHLYQDKGILDGELYNHILKDDFNKIVSLVKKKDPTTEQLEESKNLVQFHAYDFPQHAGVFSERYEALKIFISSMENPGFHLVPTYEVFSEKDIEKHHEQFLELGYEGSIIRLDSAHYENGRTSQLLKNKDFIDQEFEIIGYIEGKGGRAGTIGKFCMKHDKDSRSNFDCNVKGDFKYLRKVWENRDSYIGKTATVKYFNRTPYKPEGGGDKPRFGYIIKIAREDYE